MARLVEIVLSDEFLDQTMNTKDKVDAAIGYLACWAANGDSDRYKGKASIYGDSRGDLHASYRNPQGEVTYNLFGQRDIDGSYSFHS